MQVSTFIKEEENSFEHLKISLLKQQKEIDDQIASLALDDATFSDDIPESTEMGTVSWQEDVRSSQQALRQGLLKMKKQVNGAISKLETGTYGKCEKCKKGIEESRLNLLPTAALCMVCMVA